MKTDELIDVLARAPEAAPPQGPKRRLALALALGLMAATLVIIVIGVRPDIGAARMPVMMKAMFSAGVATAALPLLMRLARPGRPIGWRLGALLGFFALAGLYAAVVLMGADPGERFTLWMGGAFPWCIAVIPLLAAPTAALLTRLLRDLAPTNLTAAGAALGAVSGGIGAMAYALYCPTDSAAFVVTWYSVGIAISAALGAVLGARLLRW